jgi:hypothetical protein
MMSVRGLLRLLNHGVPPGAPVRVSRKMLRRMLVRQGIRRPGQATETLWLWELEQHWPEVVAALRARWGPEVSLEQFAKD